METNNKHTPTPWRLIKGTKEKLSKIKKGKYTLELQGYGYEQEKEIKDAEFIVTACNSYEALKQQNEEYMELLKELKNFIGINCPLSDEFEEIQDKITETLTKYNK